MVEPLHDLGTIGEEEDTSPCSLTAFMKQYARDANAEHAGFMAELNFSGKNVIPMPHLAACTRIFSDLRIGVRELAWVPSGINILEHLDSFFIRWKLPRGVETLLYDDECHLADQVDATLKINKAQQSWVVSWPMKNDMPKEEIATQKQQSGFHFKVIHPDVVTTSFMIARAIFRSKPIPFASTSERLLFVRTGTRVSADYCIAIAYVPNRGVYYRAQPIEANQSSLVDSGLVVVSLI